jgi:hypothetical protein
MACRRVGGPRSCFKSDRYRDDWVIFDRRRALAQRRLVTNAAEPAHLPLGHISEYDAMSVRGERSAARPFMDSSGAAALELMP